MAKLRLNITPLEILQLSSGVKFGLMILNVSLNPIKDFLHILWQRAMFKACVDGGTDQLYNETKPYSSQFLPDLISGDFDSVNQEILQFYKDKGCEIVHTPDQNQTDFTKALRIILNKHSKPNKKLDCIVAIGSSSGRFDHIMGNIETLYLAEQLTDCPVYLLSEECISCLLPPGKSQINVNTGFEGIHCGLIPIGCPSRVTTSGLVWNLNNNLLQFGILVSSSNKFDGSGIVFVETDKSIVWTMSILKPESPYFVETQL